ncbi:MAG: hypothetical protein DI587_38020 [Variovorax paradoxus]|nr:MAG: hypothetical protein DI583_38020 [Variovorax paradoxus]PZP99820.1 MAG: hypothetical protein DI587_38020 [Variovorax paradoxus]
MSVVQALMQGRKRRSITWSLCKNIWDGDSLPSTHGTSAATRIPALVQAQLGAGALSMVAIGGQTIQDMIDNPTDVDNAFDPSKQFNVLFTFAGTNGMIDGPTVQAQRMRRYLRERKEAHPELLIVLGGLIPRYEASAISIDQRNEWMVGYNRIAAASWRTWGADAYVDLRPKGGRFDLPDWSWASFERPETQPIWSSADAANVDAHLSDFGHAHIAPFFTAGARRL